MAVAEESEGRVVAEVEVSVVGSEDVEAAGGRMLVDAEAVDAEAAALASLDGSARLRMGTLCCTQGVRA